MRFSDALFIASRIGFGISRESHVAVIVIAPVMALVFGVAILIIVLSVINGFQEALQTRVLNLIPHVTLYTTKEPELSSVLGAQLANRKDISRHTPFIDGLVLASSVGIIRAAKLTNIKDVDSGQLSNYLDAGGHLPSLPFEALVGHRLAKDMKVGVGDFLVLTTPSSRITPFGLSPRFKKFRVAGTFTTLTELDASSIMAKSDDLRLLFAGQSMSQGWHLYLHDLFQAEQTAQEFLLIPGIGISGVTYWGRTHGNLYEAIQIQKAIMWLLLSLVIAVAAFNVVSGLSGLVSRKQADIAVLMTLGANKSQISVIFRWLTLLISMVGVGLGALVGIMLTLVLEDLYLWFEEAIGTGLMTQYFINYLPTRLLASDVLLVVLLALALSFMASVWPARKAVKVRPAVVLRNA